MKKFEVKIRAETSITIEADDEDEAEYNAYEMDVTDWNSFEVVEVIEEDD